MNTYVLSWPPSTNSLWRAFRGRNILSKQARIWSENASKELVEQKATLVSGPVTIDIELSSPTKRSYDPDNRVKALLDLLVKNGIIEDDNNSIVHKLSIYTQCGELFKGARVSIRKVGT